jgi:hypothetical protein
MAELELQEKSEVVNYLNNNILPKIPTEIEHLIGKNVEELNGKIHVLRCYCLQKGFAPDITDRFDTILGISQELWNFLRENTITLESIRAARRTLWSDFGSNLLDLQAILSGESGANAFKDLIMTSISVLLGWRGDVVWVDIAKEELATISKAYLLGLRNETWRFINEMIQNGNEITLEKVADIGEKMEILLQFISSDDIPVAGRVLFITQIYVLLLRLNIGKIIVSINDQSKQA